MKTIKEIKNWLLENAVDHSGDLDLSDLDLSDFNGNVYINHMKVKRSLYQDYQKVGENLFQNVQKVGKDLFQNNQDVDGSLHQYYQKIGGSLHQYGQKVGGDFYNHKLNNDEYWEEKRDCVVRIKKLKEITLEELEKMGFKLKEEK